MGRSLRRIVAILLICCFMAALGSCGTRAEARDVLCELLASASLPRGVIYSSDAPEGGTGRASASFLASLYGEDALSHEFGRLESFAIYSSARMELCEVAVFACLAASDADLVVKMCRGRVERLERYATTTGKEAPQMRVWVRGRWVFMAVCGEADALMERSSRVLAGA